MKRRAAVLLFRAHFFLAWACAVGATRTSAAPEAKPVVGGRCEGCDQIYAAMPSELSWETVIADSDEAGEPLEMSGTIYHEDGKTPAASVVLYVYHTDARGDYAPAPGQDVARRHGHLRGWMRTDARGRYKFRTIRPAPYPNGSIPAHIHPIVKEPDKNEYAIDEYVFDDDKLLKQSERRQQESRGGSGIIALEKNAAGVWIGHRDIVLGLNIPNYPEQ